MDEKENAATGQQQPLVEATQQSKLPVAPDPTPPKRHPDDNAKSDKISRSDKIMIATTIVIAVGTLVSAGAIVMQWREMVNGGADTTAIANAARQQACSAHQIAEASQRNATAAEGFATSAGLINKNINEAVKKLAVQSESAQKSLVLTQDNFITEERPYVILGTSHLETDEKGNQTLTTSAPVMWRVEFINYGKSPAINYGSAGKVFFGQDAQKLAFAAMQNMPIEVNKISSQPNAGPNGIVPPQGTDAAQKPTYTTILSDKAPTSDELRYVTSHEFALYAVGRLFYTDLRGNRYSTDYCRFRLLSGAVAECSKYNTVR